MAAFTYYFQTNYVLIKYLYLLILMFHYVVSSSHWYTSATNDKISKCCTNENVLAFSDNNNNRNNSEIDSKNNNYVCHKKLDKNNNVTKLIGINLKEMNKDNEYDDDDESENKIPHCIDKDVINFNDNDGGLISYNGCIDYINDTIYGITCKYSDKIPVHLINKCCPVHYSYDIIDRKCVPNDSDLIRLSSVFRNSIGILMTTASIPNCTNNEVFVEYHTSSDRLQIIDHSELEILLTQGGYENLPSRSYCIEAITDNDNDGGSDNANLNQIIVRGCRPKTICEQIPCVRRCCKNEQIYRRIDNIATCMDYDRNFKPIFHDIELPMHENSMRKEIELNGRLFINIIFNDSLHIRCCL